MCWQDRKTWIPFRTGPSKRRVCGVAEPQSKKSKLEPENQTVVADPCTICFINSKNACFIHGQCSHQVCCYPCAKKIIKNKETCPVCRRKIEKITRHFIY